jgi:hypothetical protein
MIATLYNAQDFGKYLVASLYILRMKPKQSHHHNRQQDLFYVHEPSVECIGKRKVHKRYEFDCTVNVAASDTYLVDMGYRSHGYTGNVQVYVDKRHRGRTCYLCMTFVLLSHRESLRNT